jgi:hypothetical protein
MRRWLKLALMIVALCIGASSRAAAAFSLSNPNSWPVIPIPEIVTDPYTGTLVGLMTVFLRLDANSQIQSIIAPDINYNSILGAGATFRYLAYPSVDSQWYLIGGGSQEDAYSIESDYAIGMARQKRFSFESHFLFERNPTERFFGLGNQSSYGNQTNYALFQIYLDAILGLNLTPHFQIAIREQPRFVRIYRGAIAGSSLPYTGTRFPFVKGLDGGTEVMNELVASYDTRDSLQIPSSGGLVAVFAGIADRSFLSSASYSELVGDATHYLQIGKRVILAGHLYLRYVPAGNEAPFWARSWLGGDGPGESSLLGLPVSYEQTWRGGGAGRYIDNNLFVANLEIRTRVFEADLFNTHGIAELAPFLDLGRVFHDVTQDPFAQLHPAGGIGVRAIALPYVVAYVDVGYGGNTGGINVFTGINYPF